MLYITFIYQALSYHFISQAFLFLEHIITQEDIAFLNTSGFTPYPLRCIKNKLSISGAAIYCEVTA